MSQLRLDPLTGRWVIVSGERSERPEAFLPRTPTAAETLPCPFCPEQVADEPATYESLDSDGNWETRVVANRYPALDGIDPMAVTNLGPVFTQANGSGIHEVLILTPDHDKAWTDLSDEEILGAMTAICNRLKHYETDHIARYAQVILNSGRESGASLEHPHAQLLGMPFVPRELVDEQAGFARFQGNCLLCTTANAETEFGFRMVDNSDRALAVCPFWSRSPYEMLLIPKVHGAQMHEANDVDLLALGQTLRTALTRLTAHLGDVPYNVVFHSAPYRHSGDYHWHVHVYPKLVTRAGFELGTGVAINIIPPESAAEQLRNTTSVG